MNLFFGFPKRNSGEIARNRLKLLLVSDKADCSAEILEMIKNDMVHVISRYMEVDPDGMEIRIARIDSAGRKRRTPVLYANIPIREIPNDRTPASRAFHRQNKGIY